MKRRKPVAIASDRTPEVDSELLSAESGRAYTDEYSHDERLLNEFTKLHPMLRRVQDATSAALPAKERSRALN